MALFGKSFIDTASYGTVMNCHAQMQHGLLNIGLEMCTLYKPCFRYHNASSLGLVRKKKYICSQGMKVRELLGLYVTVLVSRATESPTLLVPVEQDVTFVLDELTFVVVFP
jgi:hypothetical protein